MSTTKHTVLLTNDDGPPGVDSPYIYGLSRHLTALGWDVKVVLPSSQKSWIGKAYHITEIVKGRFYYPQDPDGHGEFSDVSRPLKDGETAEWILLDGTPATCANVGIHNIYPGQIDLLVSGPNLGRNTSSAFALSSGTIGAALSSSLARTRAIAVSYGTVMHPTPKRLHDPAHRLSAGIINYLWSNWGADEGGPRNGEVDFYSVNLPMVEELLSNDGLQIVWTTMWRNSYGRLFETLPNAEAASLLPMSPAGPDSSLVPSQLNGGNATQTSPKHAGDLIFKFAPNIDGLINPLQCSLPIGSDGWAISEGYVSVTPLRASFAEPPEQAHGSGNKIWKIKL